MKALITGATSGIGKDIALYLSKLGYDLFLVARDKDELAKVKKEFKTKVKTIALDLSVIENSYQLYEMLKHENIEILVNNAGFGVFGLFNKTNLDKELSMINLNIKTVHLLTKLFLIDMKKRNRGYILNVSSSSAFQAGPLMATYYATKAYILRLTMAIYEELRKEKSKVVVSALCPGPVSTNFNKVAGVEFNLKSLKSEVVAKYGIEMMFKKKLLIIPGFHMKLLYLLGKIMPLKWSLIITYHIQRRKKSVL